MFAFVSYFYVVLSQVTFGVFGYPEFIVSEPISPKEIVRVIYEKCMPFDPVEAVLQQEVTSVLYVLYTEYVTVL